MASNLSTLTRQIVEKSWKSAICYGMPLLTRLLERDQFVPGGIYFEQIYQSADLESLVSFYGPNTPLPGGDVEMFEKPHWHVSYMTVPVTQTVDERVMNDKASDAQLVNIAETKAKAALSGIKKQMAKYIYSCVGDVEIDASHTKLQGLVSALMEDTTYAGIARTSSATVYPEWQAADEDNWDTAYAINKGNLNNWLDAVSEYDDEDGTYMVIMGPTLWNALASQFESQNIYEPNKNSAKQGFDSMWFNNVEIVKDKLLDRMAQATTKHYSSVYGGAYVHSDHANSLNAGLSGVDSTVGTSYVFILNLDTWHFRYYQDGDQGPFEMTDFVRQSQMENGTDTDLARMMWKGQLTCDMPNRNMMRANVS